MAHRPLGSPSLLGRSASLMERLSSMSHDEVAKLMKISPRMADAVMAMHREWSTGADSQTPAIDAFIGDIYSGLQVRSWSDDDRMYAHRHLVILSGLYGALSACDGVMPYRYEMGYKLPDGRSMYDYWGAEIAQTLDGEVLVNLSAVEYTKAVLPYMKEQQRIITPKFLTISPKTGEPTFVAVHAKVARGAFARWMIQSRIKESERLLAFSSIGYLYDAARSTPDQPVFICEKFGGTGLSVRLSR